MSDFLTILPKTPALIGDASDHGGYELKEYLIRMLRRVSHKVIDFSDGQPKLIDDYPDFFVPLACAVTRGEVNHCLAICGGRPVPQGHVFRLACVINPFMPRTGAATMQSASHTETSEMKNGNY